MNIQKKSDSTLFAPRGIYCFAVVTFSEKIKMRYRVLKKNKNQKSKFLKII
ncbi:MAG: hypothetical protein RBQ94_00160 [Methanimicrococcus sp.]|nr:hypothetical protein [Methanimicrococcus sp.]